MTMQQTTHPRLHVRDARDAHTVFEAVRQGLLSPVLRRLNEIERSMHVRSGSVFVWEECDDESGLKRWTDGRVWSQSRMREPYLFYDERLPSEQDSSNQGNRSPTYRFVDGNSRGVPASPALAHYDRSSQHPAGLVKQAYSAWITIAPNSRPKKWHLTAYFTYADLPNIPTVDKDPILRRIIVPHGIYRSGKARSRNDGEDDGFRGSAPITEPNHYANHYTAHYGSQTLPPLPSTIPLGIHPLPHPHGARLPEDQRLIQMLNSRHVS